MINWHKGFTLSSYLKGICRLQEIRNGDLSVVSKIYESKILKYLQVLAGS